MNQSTNRVHQESSRFDRATVIKWIMVVAIVLGVFFRGYHLDKKTFWGDEIVATIRMLGHTEAEIVRAGPQSAPPATSKPISR